MEEQFDFLMEHYRRSQLNPDICTERHGLCPLCVRYVSLMDVLMAPFKVTKGRKALAA